mmetsp:Transcript_21270/g.86972  ORF Transcript_21270/g.86972 Transcript_21270/m.86972 type:complete len:95 (-) Transcript_21270:1323-1607(-)
MDSRAQEGKLALDGGSGVAEQTLTQALSCGDHSAVGHTVVHGECWKHCTPTCAHGKRTMTNDRTNGQSLTGLCSDREGWDGEICSNALRETKRR